MTRAALRGVKLYELREARDVLDQFLVEEEGVETPEIAELFARLAGEIDQKVEDTALWIKELVAEATAIRTEEQRFAERRRTLENRVERTKSYLAFMLEQLDRDKINGLLVTVSLQNNSPSLEGELTQDQLAVLEGNAFEEIRACVKLVPATRQLDRAAALRLLKSGGTIAGLGLQHTRSLRIR